MVRTRFTFWRSMFLALGLSLPAVGSSPVSAAEPAVAAAPAQGTADALMLEAHNGRAEWHNFSGFTAKFRAEKDGEQASGTLTVTSDGDVKIEPASGEAPKWLVRSLDSLIGHRLASSGAVTGTAFADDDADHPRGRLLKSATDTDKSLWRVQGDLLTEVHRVNDKTRFVISVGEVHRTAEGKHLPQSFVVTTWDNASGAILSSRQVVDQWKRVGHLDLPTRHEAVTSKPNGVRESEVVELSGHALTPGRTAAR